MADLHPIYERLHGVEQYHPINAETFADWAMEAGDIVKVSRDGQSYRSPVHSSTMRWRGKQMITINSEGNREREAISRVSQRKYGRGNSGFRNGQAFYWEMTSEDGMLHASISASETMLRSDISAAKSSLYSVIQQTATNIYMHVADVESDLQATIEITASEIRQDVSAAKSSLYSTILQTATNIYMHVADVESDLQSTIEVTASGIRQDVSAAKSSLYSTIQQTATNIYMHVADVESDLQSSIEITASGIRSDVSAAKSSLYSAIVQTATSITLSVDSAKSELHASIEITASGIRSDVSSAKSDLYSSIVQTSTSIALSVDSAKSELQSSIEVTANGIRTDVSSDKSDLYSAIVQTSTSIVLSVDSAKSDLHSAIVTSADGIRTEVASANSTLWSSIDQTSTAISLKVGKGEVISSINLTEESATINASKINLQGYVTASNISTHIANLTTVNVNTIKVGVGLELPNGLMLSANGVWQVSLVDNNNGTYTLKEMKLNGDERTIGTFSRATSTSLSGSWSGTQYTVTASPQGNTDSVLVSYRSNAYQNQYYFEGVYMKPGGSQWIQIPQSSIDYKMKLSGTTSGSSVILTRNDDSPLPATWSTPSFTITITVPNTEIYTSDRVPSGATNLSTLRNRFIQAQEDADYVIFKVNCSGVTRTFYMEP